MAIQIQLNKSLLSDLKAIVELGPETLARVVDRIDRMEHPPLAPADLQTVIREVVTKQGAADILLRQALSLASLRRRRELDADEVVAGIRQGLRNAATSSDDATLERWSAIEPSFLRLISSAKVETTAKVLDLSYDYANLLQTTRIVTDIRPVFDDEVTRIDGAVVSFTLRLNYDNIEGSHSLSIAMNQADVESLRQQCERALRKSVLAQETVGALPLRVTISGSKDYEPR
jgi:hypothetical protein